MEVKSAVNKQKIETVKELVSLINSKNTILIASIKNIPGSQFQEIAKKLRGKAVVKVPKKSLIIRALDSSKNSKINELKEKIDENFAILFSDLDSYELAGELVKNKSPSKAKAGQESPEDIEIEAGPTELVPGPAISELGALGIQIKIEKGKIHIKDSKIIAKKGERISQGAADLMGKLDIKPFSIGFIPLCAFDTKENKLYLEIKIDREKTIAQLKEAYSKTISFALAIGYTTEETIRFLLSKAVAHANKINRIITGEPEPVAKAPSEKASKENTKERKEEPKVDSAAGLASLFG